MSTQEQRSTESRTRDSLVADRAPLVLDGGLELQEGQAEVPAAKAGDTARRAGEGIGGVVTQGTGSVFTLDSHRDEGQACNHGEKEDSGDDDFGRGGLRRYPCPRKHLRRVLTHAI